MSEQPQGPPWPPRIRDILRTAPGHVMYYKDLAKKLDHPEPKRVGEICGQMVRRGQLAWVKLGTYRLRQEPRHG